MIILVFGLPGTGKTFFSRFLEKDINALYLNTDKVRIESGMKGQYNEQHKDEIYAKLREKAEAGMKSNHDIIIDGTFHKQSRRDEFSELAASYGQMIYFIEIKAAPEVVKNRLSMQRKNSEADFDIYKQVKNEYDTFPGAHLELWSDRENIEKMIIKAKNYIYGYPADKCHD
jgi:predicted kinase